MLNKKSTGEIVNTRYTTATTNELKLLKKQGWIFDWTIDDLKDSVIYKLTLDSDDEIQGLVALKDYAKRLCCIPQISGKCTT